MFEQFSSRSLELERLDSGEYTSAEYVRWTREMWYIHRFFGEIRAMRKSLIADIYKRRIKNVSVVDVGAGSGGLLSALRNQLSGVQISTVGIEMNADAAKSMHAASIHAVRADAIRLPFADASFDYAMCSLFLHHLDEHSATLLLREMGRVARRGIYVIDLNRSPIPYYFYKFFGRIFLQRFTVEDGALSIRRAYRPTELLELSDAAGLTSVTIKRSAINRLVLSGKGKNR